MAKLSNYLNIKADPQLSANVKRVLEAYLDNVVPLGNQINKAAQNYFADKSVEYDVRETSRLGWLFADDISLSKPAEDVGLNQALSYPLSGQIQRENLLDKFYSIVQNMDFRKMDYSCLSRNDKTSRMDNGLTQSECDMLKTMQMVILAQCMNTKAQENREYYLNRKSLLSPIELYKEVINREYAFMVGEGIQLFVFRKNGYSGDLSKGDRTHNISMYNMDVSHNNSSSSSMGIQQKLQMREQIYAYRMAMVNGDTEVPEPVLKFNINDNWNFDDVDSCFDAIKAGATPSNTAKDQVAAIANAITGNLDGLIDKSNPKDKFSQIFIDGVSVSDYCEKIMPKNLNDYTKYYFYASQLIKAMRSGEHHVETVVRYMDNKGDMKATFMSYEPDLTPLAQAEKEANHSWFRRTFFDWGPFKIKTCKTRQQALKAADTKAAAEARHSLIESKYHIISATNANPKKIYLVPNEIESLEKVKHPKKPDFMIWRQDLLTKKNTQIANKKSAVSVDYNINIFNNIHAITNDSTNCFYETFFMVATNKFGAGNAISLISRLANNSETPQNLITEKQQNMVKEIGEEKVDSHYRFQHIHDVTAKSLEYIFKNEGIENKNVGVTLDILKSISKGYQEEKFVNAVYNLVKPSIDIEEKCGDILKNLEKNPNDKVSEQDLKFLNDKILEQKINVILSNKFLQELDKGPFTDATYNSEGAEIIKHYFGESNEEYENIVNQVKANSTGFFKNDNPDDVLYKVFLNKGFITDDFVNTVQNVLNGVDKQAKGPAAAHENAKQLDSRHNQKVPENIGVAPVPQA